MEVEDFIIGLVTVPNMEEARRISEALVKERLVACSNIVSGVESIYRWEGEVQSDAEVLCIFKTRKALFGALRDRVLELHSYDVPEVIAMDIIAGNRAYLEWLGSSCRGA